MPPVYCSLGLLSSFFVRRISQLLGRHNIIFIAEARVPDLRHLQPQPFSGKLKTLETGLISARLSSGNNIIELHSYRLFCLRDNGAIGIGYKHNPLLVPLATMRVKMASLQKVTILCGHSGKVQVSTVPIMLKSSLYWKSFWVLDHRHTILCINSLIFVLCEKNSCQQDARETRSGGFLVPEMPF